MEILEFKEQNIVIAKDQPPYLPLPVYRTKDGEVTSCWGLSFIERIRLLFTGKIYFTLLTFNQKIQPQRASLNIKYFRRDQEIFGDHYDDGGISLD